MSKPEYIQAVIYVINAHSSGGRFVVPKEVLNALKLTDEDPIHLEIYDDETGEQISLPDEFDMRSGPEIYGRNIKEIASKQRLRIIASRVD